MSGIYIPGMGMPTEGGTIVVYKISGNYSAAIILRREPGKKNFFPLRPVPDHGRLIDADALIEDLERQCKAVFRIDAVSPDDYWITSNEAYNEALWKTWVESFGKYLKTRPTIIQAEED